MDYKITALKDQIYKNFVLGIYGIPKVPSSTEVMQKIQEITTVDYSPLASRDRLSDFDYSKVKDKFSNIIDDINVLFSSVEAESKDVLDQLTNSLKEYNGVNRELRRINSRTNDIIEGKLGEEYLNYNFSESFDDLEAINTLRSSQVNTDAGTFTIKDDSGKVLSFNHYIGKKLQFNVTENYSKVIEYGFVGNQDAASILTKSNPKQLLFRVKTVNPTRLTIAVPIQLTPNGEHEEINSVAIALDSGVTKGYVRLYYQKDYKWIDVPVGGVKEVKGDSITFNFPTVRATHIKLEFIKSGPDILETNEFYVSLNALVVGKATFKRNATLYSNPIDVESYSDEVLAINNISFSMDADIPDECEVRVYVAPDVELTGSFVNSANISVPANSVEAVDFDPFATGSLIYLSDVWSRGATMSGLAPYRSMEFDWQEVRPKDSYGDVIPEAVGFGNTSKKPLIENSIFSANQYLFGDLGYGGTPVPISGWCNTDNPAWDLYLSGAVESGWLVSGVELATPHGIDWEDIMDSQGNIASVILEDPLYSGQWLGYGYGYPWGYISHFGDYSEASGAIAVNGWWRPYIDAVTPTGINQAYINSIGNQFDSVSPDFYFNGIRFFRIYRYGFSDQVIDSSIRLYVYQERPVGSEYDIYPHSFIWNYKSSWSTEARTIINQTDSDNATADTFSGYTLTLPGLESSEEYIGPGVTQVKQHGANFILNYASDYTVIYSNGSPIAVSLTPMVDSFPYLRPEGMSFDITYNYRIKNLYSSSWVGFALVSPGVHGEVIVKNPKVRYKEYDVVGSISVEDLDRGGVTIIEKSEGFLKIDFDASDSTTNRHFKIIITCASDEGTGFSAQYGGGRHWVPNEKRGNIIIPAGIRLVPRLESIKVVDLSTLVYDTPSTNDRRCAIITESNTDKYLVVKVPSKDAFPGYLFNRTTNTYILHPEVFIENKGHFVRRAALSPTGYFYYTTGSSGTAIYDQWWYSDTTWNDGQTLGEYPNTEVDVRYPVHSTHSYPLNLEDSSSVLWTDNVFSGGYDLRAPCMESGRVGSLEWSGWIENSEYASDLSFYNSQISRGYTPSIAPFEDSITNKGNLFYNTAENLPAYYSISYRTLSRTATLADRFLYKIELSSNGSRNLVPSVKHIKFHINEV